MPFVHIRSLPFDPPLDVPAIVRRVSCDLSDVLGISADHVTVTWELLAPGHYAVGGRTEYTQPPDSHPILVEVQLPDTTPGDTVQRLMAFVADALVERARVQPENVFVGVRRLRSGEIMDLGRIVRW